MKTIKRKRTDSAFYVVQFIELPFEGIDNYICVPYSWIVRKEMNQVIVAYPKNEIPIITRMRVKGKERSNFSWRCYKAVIKYESVVYIDAEHWIVTQRDFGALRAPSIKMTNNNQEHNTDDVSKNEPTPFHLLNTPKMSAQLCSHMNGVRLLEPVDNRRLMNVNTVDPRDTVQSIHVASVSQNHPSTSPTCTNFVQRLDEQQSLPTQQQYPTLSSANLPTNRDTFEQELLNKSRESNNYDNQPHTISSKSSVEQTSANLSNLLYLTSKFPQEKEPQLNQQNPERPTQRPKYDVDISRKPKNIRQPTLHGVTKKTPSPNLAKRLNSIQQTLLTTRNKYLLNEQQSREKQSERAYHGVHSDSNYVTHNAVITEYETPTYKDIETANNMYCSSIPSESSSHRLIAAQTSTLTNHQISPQLVLKQQILDKCGALLTKIGATVRYSCDKLSNLQSSIIATGETHKRLFGLINTLNATGRI